MTGRGIMVKADGQIEEGWWKDGILSGKGRVIMPTLDYFDGYFVEGKLHGEGIYFNNQNGYSYKG